QGGARCLLVLGYFQVISAGFWSVAGKWIDGQYPHSLRFFAASATHGVLLVHGWQCHFAESCELPRLLGSRRHQSISSSPVRLGYDRGTHSLNNSRWGEKRCHNSSRVVPNGGPSRSGIK